MKKFAVFLAAAMLTVFAAGVTTAFAYSGSVSIEGDREVLAGTSHKYTITVSVEDAGAVLADIQCTGAFIKESGDSMIEWAQSSNLSGVIYTGSVTVRVSSAAKAGETGTISVTGSVVSYVDDKYNTDEKDFSGSITAQVAASQSGSSTPQPSEWDGALKGVQSMQQGAALSLNITENAVIPGEVLSTLMEKQGTLKVNFNGYSCLIDGKTLTGFADSMEDADLTMNTDKEKALSEAAGGKDLYQLNFERESQLPGVFKVSFKAADSKPGDVLYLYRWYGSSGVIEGIETSVVNADGFAAFDIYYCSGYIISGSIIEGAAGTDFGTGNALSSELQAQLNDTLEANGQLKAQLGAEKQNEASLAAQYQQYQGALNLSPAAFAAAVCGAAALAVLLTMLFCKAGIFRRKVAAPRETLRADGSTDNDINS